jgi:4-carboxymuconolactone decarboxylase
MTRVVASIIWLALLTSASAQEIAISRSGSRPSQTASDEHFTGSVRVDPLFDATGSSRMIGSSVTFERGARTAWHTHPLGQVLVVTAGRGRVQRWDGLIDEIRQGDVVRIPPDVKHWHGATDSAMTHIALLEQINGRRVEWMERVSDTQYGAPVRAQGPSASAAPTEPTRAQQLIGDFSPKLVELTDNVLFGDVWARPELSPRDRSLVTVSALIAMGNREQLRSHLLRARENGVTQTELVETITHLALYAGWPNAITAITVAKEVCEAGSVIPYKRSVSISAAIAAGCCRRLG